MKYNNSIVIVLVFTVFLNACNTKKRESKDIDSSTIESLYFGQKPPGLKPEVFAPGVLSINGRFESTISFSPDLEELYFDAKNEDEASQIYVSKLVNGTWTPIKKSKPLKEEI